MRSSYSWKDEGEGIKIQEEPSPTPFCTSAVNGMTVLCHDFDDIDILSSNMNDVDSHWPEQYTMNPHLRPTQMTMCSWIEVKLKVCSSSQ
jgi:hypothetical protein